MKFLKTPLTSSKLEATGQAFYIFGKIGMFSGVCGIALTILMGLISVATGADFFSPMIYDISMDYAFAFPFIWLADLGLLLGVLGVPSYFYGLHLFGHGRIAVNTEKETNLVANDELPEL